MSVPHQGRGDVALALDAEGGAHVSYGVWHDRPGSAELRVAYRSPLGEWTRTPIDARGAGLSKANALDDAGGIHVAYFTEHSAGACSRVHARGASASPDGSARA